MGIVPVQQTIKLNQAIKKMKPTVCIYRVLHLIGSSTCFGNTK